MVMEKPFLFQDTDTAAAPSSDVQQDSGSNDAPATGQPVTVPTTESGSGSDDPPPVGQPVTVPTTGESGPGSNDPPPTGQSVTEPTTGQPGSDSNNLPSVQQPGEQITVPTTESPEIPNDKTTKPTPNQPETVPAAGTNPDSKVPSSVQQPGEPATVPTTESPENSGDKTTKPTQNQPETVPSAGQIPDYKPGTQQIWRDPPSFDQQTPGSSPTKPGDQSSTKSDEEMITWRRRHRTHRRPQWDASSQPTTPETSQEAPNLKLPAGDQTGGVHVASADFGSSSDDNQFSTSASASNAELADWTQFDS